MSSSSDEFCSDIEKGAAEAASAIIPEKSKELYETAYKKFVEWSESKKTDSVCEKVLQSYFNEKSKAMKPSTLWSLYSKLKATIFLNRNVDISKYATLHAFLKRKNVGHISKKSDILCAKDFDRYITEAEDKFHVLTKVALIVGIAGTCRKIELFNMLTEHVIDHGEYVAVKIPETKTYEPREFVVIPGKVGGMDLLDTIRRYIALRPAKTPHNRLFLGYRNGKCTIQPVGINTFSSMPRKIAEFLGLEHPERFTGHCFRRSSATVLGEKGANLWTVKKAGGWKSSAVAEQYIHNTLSLKRNIAETIFGSNDGATPSKRSNAEQEDILFDANTNGMATVRRIISSQITKESVAIPSAVAPAFPSNSSISHTSIPPEDSSMSNAPIFQPSPISHSVASPCIATSSSSSTVASNAPIFPPNSLASLPQMPISSTSSSGGINSVPANIVGSTFQGCYVYFMK